MLNQIILNWPPKELNPNARVHWAKKAMVSKKYKSDCYILTKEANIERPKTEWIHLYVYFYPPDRRKRDQDNMEAAMKSAYDGIADALKVNDLKFVIHPFVKDEIVKYGKVIITITGN